MRFVPASRPDGSRHDFTGMVSRGASRGEYLVIKRGLARKGAVPEVKRQFDQNDTCSPGHGATILGDMLCPGAAYSQKPSFRCLTDRCALFCMEILNG